MTLRLNTIESNGLLDLGLHHTNQHNAKQTAIVIGGGIAGCSTAYALAKRGIAVTLIERHAAVAQEASGNPVAMLYPKLSSGGSVPTTLASEGFSFTLGLLKQLGAHHTNPSKLFQLCGQIQLALNQREQEKQQLLLNDALISHPALQLLSASDASEVAHLNLSAGGIYLPDAGWVNPQLFCEALLNVPMHSDLITRSTSTEAINITYDGVWTVSLNKQQSLSADAVVLCNANELHQFDDCKHLPITTVRGQVNFFQANASSQAMQSIVCSDHYLSPAVNGMHSIGTSFAPNDLNPELSDADTQANLAALKQISPAILNSISLPEVTGRVAWRSATRDFMPLAGQLINEAALTQSPPRYNDHPLDLPWLKGLYVNAGHGSKGMITAPMCGELVANLITTEPLLNKPLLLAPSIAAKLNPSRFLLRDAGLKQLAQRLYTV